MQIQPRCYTCGKVIGHVFDDFIKRTEEKGEDPGKVLDDLGLKRFCCKRMIISHREIIEELIKFV